MRRVHLLCVASAVLILCGSSRVIQAQENEVPAGDEASASNEAGDSDVFWQNHLAPLFQDKCQRCHGGAKQEAGVDLRTELSVLKGGDAGAIVGLSVDESRLWQVVQPSNENRMPPEGEPLTEDERLLVKQWLELNLSNASSPNWDEAQDAEFRDPFAIDPSSLLAADVDPTIAINQLLANAWSRDAIDPAPLAGDAQWVRRVYLDLLGRVPTTAERDAFLSSTDPLKHQALVDQLLIDPQYAQHMAQIFDTVFLGRSRRQRERREKGWIDFLERSFANNRPWNEVVRAIALARPEQAADQGAAWYLHERGENYQEIAESISPAIFGVQIQCAQCHDHPLASEIKQAHYWGLVAFFNRGKPAESPQGPQVSESAIGGFSNFANLEGVAQPNLLVYLGTEPVAEERPADPAAQTDSDDLYAPATGVDGAVEGLPRVPRFSRRQAFADHVVAGHPWVARAMVNRLWALVFGRGLVHPVDKIDSTHPASHPELFAWLSRDFEASGYDVRRMLRALVLSDAYRLSSQRPTPATSPDSFAYALDKPLTAEAMGRSLSVALEDRADAQPGQRQRMLTEIFPEVFPEVPVTTLTQTLFLTNHVEFNQWFHAEGENLTAQLVGLGQSDAMIDLAFDRMLGRAPSSDEREAARRFITERGERIEVAAAGLVWALATSAEFRFNH